MPNISKLTKELLKQIKKLAEEGYNKNEISKIVGFNKSTVSNWISKNEIQVQNYGTKKGYLKYKKFKSILKEYCDKNEKVILNEILRQIKMSPGTANSILKKHPNLRNAIRSKKDAITYTKTLSIQKAESRLPINENSKVLGFEKGKYKIETEDGYIYYKSSAKIKQGDPRGKSGTPKNIDAIKNELKELGYEYVSGYKGRIRESITAIHLKCGELRTNRLSNFKSQECSICNNNGKSAAEQEILEWVRQWYPEAHSTRQIIGPKEIDIYIPSLNLAIEYCGLYWHNENSPQPRGRNYHRDKMLECEKKGIRLITIFEDEWVDRHKQVKNFLKSVMRIHDRRIYARKCQIKEVDKKEARTFLDKNHIQGKTAIKVAFGLYYEGELLGLITGSFHHRKTDQFTLNRLVFDSGVQIPGGASRLLKHLVSYAKQEGYSTIVSWSDNRYSQGNVYEKCGFTLEQELPPDYSYVTPDMIRESKQSNKKKLLLKKGATGTMANTEKELSLTLGYSRIWDCGKKRFIINF